VATYQLVVTVELERLDANDGAMAWRGSAKQTRIGTLAELQSITAVCALASELATQLVKAEQERTSD